MTTETRITATSAPPTVTSPSARYYGHVRTTYSYKSIRKTIFKETDSGTYPERIVKYLLKIGVPQQDIDDLRAIMLE